MAEESELRGKLNDALELVDVKDDAALSQISAIVAKISVGNIKEGDNKKVLELSIEASAKLLAKKKDLAGLKTLLETLKSYFPGLPKSKAANLVKRILAQIATIEGTEEDQIKLCKETIEWATSEKRNFLRLKVETNLASLYLDTKRYAEALELLARLLKEVKKIDDKNQLLEIQLLESRVQHKLRNKPKAKAALTAARTSANAIYCHPLTLAQIDMHAGTLYATERDFKIAYSFFYEAFEAYDSLNNHLASTALKYMLLCKIMIDKPEEVRTIVSGKLALKYAGRQLEAMKAIADAHKNRSLKEFGGAKEDFKAELLEDSLVGAHLGSLYDTLLEQNLLRIIEPYSSVEIAQVAKLIELDVPVIERKLSQMILDKKFEGILDQGAGCLNVFAERPKQEMFEDGMSTVEEMNGVVDALFAKASRLS